MFREAAESAQDKADVSSKYPAVGVRFVDYDVAQVAQQP
jgi:hypothetical protein